MLAQCAQQQAFYLLHTRAWSLGCGVLLALTMRQPLTGRQAALLSLFDRHHISAPVSVLALGNLLQQRMDYRPQQSTASHEYLADKRAKDKIPRRSASLILVSRCQQRQLSTPGLASPPL